MLILCVSGGVLMASVGELLSVTLVCAHTGV